MSRTHRIRTIIFSLCLSTTLAAALILQQDQTAPGGEFPPFEQLASLADYPDPLVFLHGRKVESAGEWKRYRAPELKGLFQHYMYGYFPKPMEPRFEVVRTDRDALNGKGTMTQIRVHLSEGCRPINLILFAPNERDSADPLPVVLGLNFTGNHSVLADSRIELPTGWFRPGPGVVDNRATEAGRGTAEKAWPIDYILGRGYAVATFYYGDVLPDRDDLSDPTHKSFRYSGAAEPKPNDWGAIACWAWGLHRGVDYLLTNREIDPKRIVVFGHSRNGKAALLAAAFDSRIAAVIPHQAGCGGTAPSRRKNEKGESVTAINDRFPHWFCDNFTEFNGKEDKLPFDQHCLMALCAPRPILLTNGSEDQWADPGGQFEMLIRATPVYRLQGTLGMPDEIQAPALNERLGKELQYYERPGPHVTDQAYWKIFLDFADEQVSADF